MDALPPKVAGIGRREGFETARIVGEIMATQPPDVRARIDAALTAEYERVRRELTGPAAADRTLTSQRESEEPWRTFHPRNWLLGVVGLG